MGTTAKVVVLGGSARLGPQAAERLADLERRWSRFRDDSELARLNRAVPGTAVAVSFETYLLVEHAVAAWRLTAGRFDPTVLSAVVANGYDRTFAQVPADRAGVDHPPVPAPGCAGIELDAPRRTVMLPAGVRLDPGGIGKGLAADLVAEWSLAQGARGVLVDVGGDIRVAGEGPEDGRWVVDVEHPWRADRPLLHLWLRDAGIATSSRLARRWRVNGGERHHLVDPATGRSTTTPIVAATVIAGQAWWAEALTKSLFVGGDLGAVSDASAIVVDADGNHRATPDLEVLVS